MNTILRHTLTAGVLVLCTIGLNVQSQTASPGPGSRNANVDREDPNKPDTPEHEIPSQEAPGSGNNNEEGAAGTSTPTGGDGSNATVNRDPTQPIQGQQDKQTPPSSRVQDCDTLTGESRKVCEQELAKSGAGMPQKQSGQGSSSY